MIDCALFCLSGSDLLNVEAKRCKRVKKRRHYLCEKETTCPMADDANNMHL